MGSPSHRIVITSMSGVTLKTQRFRNIICLLETALTWSAEWLIGEMSTVEPHHGEPVRKKQKTLDAFLGKKTLDRISEKKGDRAEERDGALPKWSKIEENGLNISQAVVIDAQESKRLFLQLENEVCFDFVQAFKSYTSGFRLSISQAAWHKWKSLERFTTFPGVLRIYLMCQMVHSPLQATRSLWWRWVEIQIQWGHCSSQTMDPCPQTSEGSSWETLWVQV